MQQRDFIKEQIEQLGRSLGKIIAGFLGYKTQGTITQGIEITNQQLQSELDIDIEKLVGLNAEELKHYLESKQFTDLHLDMLSEYLFEIGQSKSDQYEATVYYQTAIRLIDLTASYSNTLTFDRMKLRARVEEELGKELN